jgi:Cd2+/Zn2+-exporting ATPase
MLHSTQRHSTGESTPDTKAKGEIVLAGMINLNLLCQVTVAYTDSKPSKNFEMVQDATVQKSTNRIIYQKVC